MRRRGHHVLVEARDVGLQLGEITLFLLLSLRVVDVVVAPKAGAPDPRQSAPSASAIPMVNPMPLRPLPIRTRCSFSRGSLPHGSFRAAVHGSAREGRLHPTTQESTVRLQSMTGWADSGRRIRSDLRAAGVDDARTAPVKERTTVAAATVRAACVAWLTAS
jgi:hypothetical protein